jgi:hypothetical protein
MPLPVIYSSVVLILYKTPASTIVGFLSYLMRPWASPVASSFLTTLKDSSSATSPKTTWRLSSQLVVTVVMKNWEPLLQSKQCQSKSGDTRNPKQPRQTSALQKGAHVRIRSSIGHGQQTGAAVLLGEVLVGELLTVDRLAAGAVAAREVATLQHEVWDDAVEGGTLVPEALLASAQGAEVLRRFRDHVVVQDEVDGALLL